MLSAFPKQSVRACALYCGAALLLLTLLAMSDSAQAQWIEIDRSNIQITYVNPSLIDGSRRGKILWLMSSYKTPKHFGGKKFQSMLSQYEYNCSAEEYRILAYSLHSGKTGGGKELQADTNVEEWRKIPQRSADKTLFEKVCTPDAGWSKIGDSKTMTIYANPFTISKDDNLVELWELFDLKAPQGGKEKYLSVKHRAEYDCRSKLYRTLDVEYHTENMGRGDEVSSDGRTKKWELVTKGSADFLFWKIACGK